MRSSRPRCVSDGRSDRGGGRSKGSSGAPPHRSAPSYSPTKQTQRKECRGLEGLTHGKNSNYIRGEEKCDLLNSLSAALD